MIGLPGPRISFKRKDTSYGITAIPLGGYCAIAGMEKGNEDEPIEEALAFISYFGEVCEEEADLASKSLGVDITGGLETLADWGTVRRFKDGGLYHYIISEATINGTHFEEGDYRVIKNPEEFLASEKKLTYNSLPWWKRMIVLLAGSLSNLVIAFGTLIVILMIVGMQVTTTTVDTVLEDSPAEEAGIVSGDVLVSVDGESFEDWIGFVTTIQEHEAGDKITLGFEHEGKVETAQITLADNEGVPQVGVTSLVERQNIGILEAAGASWNLIGSVFEAILQLINPSTFADTIDQTSSVVGISMEARSAADAGVLNFVLLIAALSISIGFMNLLPIPPLDGGKIVIETIERITRRKLPVSVINFISLAGLAAMLALFVFATNADIHRYFLGG